MEVIGFVVISLLGGLAGLFAFLYHFRKGQFEDPEEAKYHLFREDE